MGTIKNIWQNINVGTKIVIAVLGLFFIIIIVIFVINLIPERQFESRVTVENFSDIDKIPNVYKKYVQDNIGDILRKNLILDESETVDAIIREDSYEEEKGNNTVRSKFIIDIDSLHYSFAVMVTWPKDMRVDGTTSDLNVMIECPHYMDVIYTDTKCIAQDPVQQLKRYLPHYDYVDDIKYAVYLKKYADEPYVRGEIPACGSTILKDKTLDLIKKWIKSVYLDPNDYIIEIVDTCAR